MFLARSLTGASSFQPMKTYFYAILFVVCVQAPFVLAQPTAGTTGLLNIPTAEMQPDGTFMFGGSWLPAAMMPDRLNFNTANYYLNLTFLPFLEISYRCTLLKNQSGGYHNQDRSIAVRGKLFRERKYLPAVVAGGNDIYTSSEKGNRYFSTFYVVTTKNTNYAKLHGQASLGYRFEENKSSRLSGIFGGVSISPQLLSPLEFIAEFDSKVLNAGLALTLFDQLRAVVFAYDLEYVTGCLMYRIQL